MHALLNYEDVESLSLPSISQKVGLLIGGLTVKNISTFQKFIENGRDFSVHCDYQDSTKFNRWIDWEKK